MTSADFSLAQKRLAARRRLREAEVQVRLSQQQNSHAAVTVNRLPFPFSRIGRVGLQGWNSVKGREGTRPAFRVGQVDAELLDEELLDLLKAQVGEALKYFGVCGSICQSSMRLRLILSSHIYGTSGLQRFSSVSAQCSLSLRSGTTMPRMVRLYRTSNTPMQEIEVRGMGHQRIGRSQCMASSRLEVAMYGTNGRIGL